MTEQEMQAYLENLNQQIQDVAATFPENERKDILRAYAYAFKHHEGQLRKSGEPYIMHPVAVAVNIAQMDLDAESIMAGLLHDTIEDTAGDSILDAINVEALTLNKNGKKIQYPLKSSHE